MRQREHSRQVRAIWRVQPNSRRPIAVWPVQHLSLRLAFPAVCCTEAEQVTCLQNPWVCSVLEERRRGMRFAHRLHSEWVAV